MPFFLMKPAKPQVQIIMDAEYRQEADEGGLYGNGICEICGKKGMHSHCNAFTIEGRCKVDENDRKYLRKYAVNGGFGAIGADSQASLEHAISVLEKRLGRELECDPGRSIEGDTWWYLPEGWSGVIGFIVEKRSSQIFVLGSGVMARSDLTYTDSAWCGILEYLKGNAEPMGLRDR